MPRRHQWPFRRKRRARAGARHNTGATKGVARRRVGDPCAARAARSRDGPAGVAHAALVVVVVGVRRLARAQRDGLSRFRSNPGTAVGNPDSVRQVPDNLGPIAIVAAPAAVASASRVGAPASSASIEESERPATAAPAREAIG